MEDRNGTIRDARNVGEDRVTRYQCAIPTQTLGHCKRPATVHFVHRNGQCVAHMCRQHSKGAGAARLLRPFAWEYDHTEIYGWKV